MNTKLMVNSRLTVVIKQIIKYVLHNMHVLNLPNAFTHHNHNHLSLLLSVILSLAVDYF